MNTPWSRWLWFGRKNRPAFRNRLNCQRLETRTTPAAFIGGVAVAAGDVDGDGFGDIVTGAGPGGGPHVQVFSGQTGKLVRSFFAYDVSFTGGVSVAVGDVNGDGFADIITGAGAGGGAHVRVFSGKTGDPIREFLPYGLDYRGGVNVAAGDVNGDGLDDVITAPAAGAATVVRVFNGGNSQEITSFNALDPAFTGGAFVSAGDLTGDGKADIAVGAGSGGGPLVQLFNGSNGGLINSFLAFDAGFRGGARVALGKVTGGSVADVVVGAGDGASPHVMVYTPQGQAVRSFLSYDSRFAGGVFVATPDFAGEGRSDILTGAGYGGGPHVNLFRGDNFTDRLVSFYAYEEVGPRAPGGPFANPVDTVDRTGPVVVITSPISSKTFTSNFTISGTVIDTGSGVAKLEVQIDDGEFSPIGFSTTGGFSFTTGFALDGSDDGSRTIRFRGTDNAGNVGSLASYGFVFDGDNSNANDTTAPTITITSPTNSPTLATNLKVEGNVRDEASGVISLEVQIDGGAIDFVDFDANGNFTYKTNFPLDGTADGVRRLEFRAVDGNNNEAVQVVTFTLATSILPPTVQLAEESDTGVIGDNITSNDVVRLIGTTSPNVSVQIDTRARVVQSDSEGNYSFEEVTLELGQNTFIVRAFDEAGNQAETSITITRNSAPTVAQALAPVVVSSNAPNRTINLANAFGDIDVVGTRLRYVTTFGNIDVELFDLETPITVANHLAYVNADRFDGTIIHRSVPGFVIQGGGFKFNSNPSRLDAVPTFAPITRELGISNTRGTLAMARTSDPNSGTSQFYFNTTDNPELDQNPNNPSDPSRGYTVFGRIVDDASLAVMDNLAAVTPRNQGGVFAEVPLVGYSGTNFPTDTARQNFLLFEDVVVTRRSDRLTYTVVGNSNTGLVTASVVGNRLTLEFAPNQTGTATLIIRATDLDGASVDQTMTVTVN